jgi:hypothetical protein
VRYLWIFRQFWDSISTLEFHYRTNGAYGPFIEGTNSYFLNVCSRSSTCTGRNGAPLQSYACEVWIVLFECNKNRENEQHTCWWLYSLCRLEWMKLWVWAMWSDSIPWTQLRVVFLADFILFVLNQKKEFELIVLNVLNITHNICLDSEKGLIMRLTDGTPGYVTFRFLRIEPEHSHSFNLKTRYFSLSFSFSFFSLSLSLSLSLYNSELCNWFSTC